MAEVESLDSTPSVEVSGMDTSVLVEDDVELGCPTLVDNDDVTKLKAEIASWLTQELWVIRGKKDHYFTE